MINQTLKEHITPVPDKQTWIGPLKKLFAFLKQFLLTLSVMFIMKYDKQDQQGKAAFNDIIHSKTICLLRISSSGT
jgi:hypothetical protein